MDCPRCKVALVEETIKDLKFTVQVDKCPNCDGIWFDKGELSRLEKVIEPTLLEIRKIPDKETQMKPLNCPSCNNLQMLKKAEHHRDKKVILDYCPVCSGIWLDKGELTAIQTENWLQTIGRIFSWLMGND